MINAITYAIDRVQRIIPEYILKQTFISMESYRTTIPVSVATRIREIIIDKWILPDINVIGGKTAYIPLDQCVLIEQIPGISIYQVPKEVTNGRSITSVHELTTMGYAKLSGGDFFPGMSEMGNALNQQLDAIKTLPYVSEGRTTLLNDNTIMVEGSMYVTMSLMVRAVLEYDQTLNDLNPRTLQQFTDLVILATKAYIYNKNVVNIDMGQLHGGVNLGVYKDMVDSYSDAHEQYEELLRTTWARVDKLNDYETRKRLINLMTGRAM